MLLSFRFANHRSFRWERQLNLTPVYDGESPVDAVPVAGIFGANASGKSNALHALWFMRQFVVWSDRDVEPDLGVTRHPFRLTPEARAEPSRYVVDLSVDGEPHAYGFTLDDERVVEEWLYHYPLRKRRRVFERDGDRFSWGEESGKRDELGRISTITAPSALFLSTVARFEQRSGGSGSDPLHAVYRWFRRVSNHSRGQVSAGARLWPDSEDDRSVVVALLRAADVGIADVWLASPTQDSLLPDLDDSDGDLASTRTRQARAMRAAREAQRLRFSHKGSSGEVTLGLNDESSGTQQLLDLAIDAAVVLRVGGTLVVDEIDASLHPMLTARLIGLFQSPHTNPRGSQLIFTSHDAALLGTFDSEEVLHRDQIWFAEKDDEGVSSLYPLSDFKPRREGENRQRRYLNGNYGGVPELSGDLFEQAVAARVDDAGSAAVAPAVKSRARRRGGGADAGAQA